MSEDRTKSHSALLVMDIQQRVTATYIGDDHTYLDRLAEAIATARKADMRVIYIRVSFRENFPEVSPNNRRFSAIRNTGVSFNAEAAEIHPAIAPQAGDIVVTKLRISAFCGSDLEVILRSQGIDHLVLCGIATSGVVLSTSLEAADKDYRLTILSDGCLDNDAEVQRVLLTKLFPRFADVVTIKEWQQAL